MQREVVVEALTPLGTSVAGAIVCASLFFVAGVAAVAYFFYTKYTWYDVVIVACFFRTVAYCCRAAYLGGAYRPALEGTFLAFANAGYGASCAAICLTLAWWYRKKPVRVFAPRFESLMMWLSIVTSLLIVCFGPILGVIAAGFIFGAYSHPVLGNRGIRLRYTASYGLVGCNAFSLLLLSISILGIYRIPRSSYTGKETSSGSKQNPRLIAILILSSLLLLIRGCAGVAALYPTKEFVWENDHFFYPLDTLPELLAFVILCWPCLLARAACCWPMEEKAKDKNLESGTANKLPSKEREGSGTQPPNGVNGGPHVVVEYN